MNKEFNEKIQKAKEIKLTNEEKSRTKNILIALMNKHKKPSIFTRAFNTMKFMLKPAYVIILMFIASGVGTAFAAESSLPGDFLYPVKTNIIEEVRGVFAFTDEQKAAWAARRIERRLEEMKKLEEKNQLRQEITERIENNFKRHEEKVNALIRKLEGNNNPNAARIKTRLQNSIEVHKAILKKLEDKKFEKLEKPKLPESKNAQNKIKNLKKINKNNI